MGEKAHVGTLLLLAIKGKVKEKSPTSKGLMLIDVKINGKSTKTVIDTGAAHNFVVENQAALSLKLKKDTSQIKDIQVPYLNYLCNL